MVADEPGFTASSAYAVGQLWRALDAAATVDDRAARERALAKAEKWRAVLSGMATGEITVGSRTPIADTPAWVTLEVAHGGFATGRFLAEAPPDEHERTLLASLPPDAPGTTDRERLNLWFLGDEGRAVLLDAVRTERFRVDVPEHAALLVVAWLVREGHYEAALDLVTELRPLMHRIRFTPEFRATSMPAGSSVRLASAGEVAGALRDATLPPQFAAMREALRVWLPLFDRLVEIWAATVAGPLPELRSDGGAVTVAGGWPCQTWPADWRERRSAWLAEYRAAAGLHRADRSHEHPRSNFARLRSALEVCTEDSSALTGRDVGWIRRALANTITKHGAPGSERRAALRAVQATVAARPTHADLARVLAGRLDRYPADGGVPSLDPLAVDVGTHEEGRAPVGAAIPDHLLKKVRRALEAPIDELVALGVITSGDVLARVLPQITAHTLAANIADPELAAIFGQTYAAFRRRRSLLLLDLEHQVQLEELPWVAAMSPFRTDRPDAARAAAQSLEQATVLALSAFPEAILPNPLLRELGALATQAGIQLPLVEEVAADIFMGMFTAKWRTAAAVASRLLDGTLYARYYDLPGPDTWAPPTTRTWLGTERRGTRTAEDFAALCTSRAAEAGAGTEASYVARNGAILEQSQILTTQNLAALTTALDLSARLATLGPDLVARTFEWIVRRHSQPVADVRAELQMVKNTAYAWRQAVFFLSFLDEPAQRSAVNALRAALPATGQARRLEPAVHGLAHVLNGGRFAPDGHVAGGLGRRFLGWSVGRHWMLPATPPGD